MNSPFGQAKVPIDDVMVVYAELAKIMAVLTDSYGLDAAGAAAIMAAFVAVTGEARKVETGAIVAQVIVPPPHKIETPGELQELIADMCLVLHTWQPKRKRGKVS